MRCAVAAMKRPALIDRLHQSTWKEADRGFFADPPSRNNASVDVDHEINAAEPRPGRYLSEIVRPKHGWNRSKELATYLIERASCHLVRNVREHQLTFDLAL